MHLLGLSGLVFLFLAEHTVLSLSIQNVIKSLHKGVDEVVKGTVNGATEVIGTPVDPGDVHFFLITSQDRSDVNNTVNQFDPKNVAQTDGYIFFFIHGWTQNRTSCSWYKPLSEVLLKQHPDSHIVLVDWGKPAADNYASAAFSTESVGQIIANVIQKLVKENNICLQKIVVIGHSLGGQISGWVGKEYKKLNNETLSRIIALDPAGPIFDVRPTSRKLNDHDADVVMVVHGDMLKFGYPDNCGTIDFLPNGGFDQPGCTKVNLTDLSLENLTKPIWCSHTRTHDIFIEAIKHPKGFMGTKCDSYSDYKGDKCDDNLQVSMGDWQTTETGSYFLETSAKSPFIKKQNTTDES